MSDMIDAFEEPDVVVSPQPPRTVFMESGGTFSLSDEHAITMHDALPRGFYDVQFSPMRGYFLTLKRDLKELPPKLYGTLTVRADRIVRTYLDRAKEGLQTGVLLSGEKGNGKTLMARYLMEICDLPVVIVSEPFCDKNFLELLSAGGRKMVFFDEFEKVYSDTNRQQMLLTMLDGYYKTANLTVCTLNDQYKIVDAMKNRPSRFYYHYRYTTLDRSFVEDYCADKLSDPSSDNIAAIHSVVDQTTGFNFDMLQVLVEEMNRFGDSPEECIKHLNIVPPIMTFRFKAELRHADDKEAKLIETKRQDVALTSLQPQQASFYLYTKKYYTAAELGTKKRPKKKAGEEDVDWYWAEKYFSGEDFVGSADGGTMLFKNRDGFVATLTPSFNARQWAA